MGPLEGLKIIELAGIGPGPFCAMMLADMGAEVIRIDRAPVKPPREGRPHRFAVNNRGRRSIAVDLKHPDGVATILDLCAEADALIEGFRPGVTERLGIGPDECLARNPALVYGRMTGWGQDGPMASAAGHDINYIALSGVLWAMGRAGEAPVPPLNLVGDFGGGGMFLAFGVVSGILHAQRTGVGQVVDAAMVDGAATLAGMFSGMRASGIWKDERGVNTLDTGAPFYDVYETSDGEHVSIGSIEPQFYAELLRLSGLEGEELPHQLDQTQWPAMKERVAEVFRSKTRAEWVDIMEGTDVCFAPVLSMAEAPEHEHNVARSTFIEVDGVVQPAPAPRFSATPVSVDLPPPAPGEHTDAALADWGLSAERIAELRAAEAIA